MSVRLKDGHVRVYVRDGTSYAIDSSEFEHVLAQWKAGAAFVHTVGAYGQTVVIKGAEIQGIGNSTAESLAAADEDDELSRREAKEREILDGGS